MDDDQFAIHVNATILDLTISLRFLDPSLVDILFYIALHHTPVIILLSRMSKTDKALSYT